MKKKKKKGIKEYYKEAFDFLKESKNYIYFSVLIFFIFSFIGFFFPIPDSLREIIMNFIEELLLRTQDLSYGGLTWFILLNNLQSSFFGMVYGIFLGIFPIVASILNGYILGFVASEAVHSNGISILWRLFPHGIFELPALFISLGLGIKLGSFVLAKNKMETLRIYIAKSLKTFLLIVIPLLIIAAIIEGSLIFLFG
jgi:stage II sporulation protein M